MPTRIVFNDHNGNELDIFLNKKNYVFLGLTADWMECYIELNKDDVGKVISLLQNLEKEM